MTRIARKLLLYKDLHLAGAAPLDLTRLTATSYVNYLFLLFFYQEGVDILPIYCILEKQNNLPLDNLRNLW